FLVDGDIARPKVLDFGIGRIGGTPRMTATGTVMGTPGYMAPEQARGSREADARVDVFALGCVLFECLTGRPPFAGEHFVAVLAKVLFADPPRVREVRADVPAYLEALVARMLAKDPKDRPPDGAAVGEALRVAAPEPTPPPVSARGAALTGDER